MSFEHVVLTYEFASYVPQVGDRETWGLEVSKN